MRFHLHLFTSILIFLLVIFAGSYTYHKLEGWSEIDSVYFTVVTATTIGYGDLHPQTDAGKIFTIFFSLFGVATVLYFISLIGTSIFKKHLKEKVKEEETKLKRREEILEKKKKINKKIKRK